MKIGIDLDGVVIDSEDTFRVYEEIFAIEDLNLRKIKDLKKCEICGHISEGDTCIICLDSDRNKNLICVIEDYKSVFAFEKAGIIKGNSNTVFCSSLFDIVFIYSINF